MACISGYSDSQGIYEYIEPYVTKLSDDVETKSYYNKVKVFVNGRWVGITDTPIELYKDLKDKKYKGLVHIYTSIVFNTNEKLLAFAMIVVVLSDHCLKHEIILSFLQRTLFVELKQMNYLE